MTVRIEHRIGIAAPPSEVWDLIYDLAGWKDWTGVYTDARGKIAIGETLTFSLRLGDQVQTTTGVVYDWVPEAQLAWEARLPGRVKSLRYVEIEPLTDTSCILANGEYRSGFASRFVSPRQRAASRAAFQTMNEHAKPIAEVRWREKGGEILAAPAQEDAGPDFAFQPLMKPTGISAKPWGFGRGSGQLGPSLKRS